MSKKGRLIVFSGPSGAGKGTLLAKILENDEFVYSVSATTRSKRPYEENGREYFFLTKQEFEDLIFVNGFLEYAQYNGCYYGTPIKFINDSVQNGKNVILEIEVQGAKQIKKLYPEALFVFVAPESIAELEARIRARGTESEESIQSRLRIAKSEIAQAKEYDFIIYNENGKQKEAVEDFMKAVGASHLCASCRYKELEKNFEL